MAALPKCILPLCSPACCQEQSRDWCHNCAWITRDRVKRGQDQQKWWCVPGARIIWENIAVIIYHKNYLGKCCCDYLSQKLSGLCAQVRLSPPPNLSTATPKSQLGLNWCIFPAVWKDARFVPQEPVGLSTAAFSSLHAPPLDNPEALFCAWRDFK